MKKSIFTALILCFLIMNSLFSQMEKERAVEKVFNFNETFHSLGFSTFFGINFAPKLEDAMGNIKPILSHSLVPEFILQYNCMIKNGFGVSIEVPFGIFKRSSLTLLSYYGASNDVFLEIGSLYVGFSGKLTFFKELHENICMQGELGLKFNPFLYSADHWMNKDINDYEVTESNITEDNSSINFINVEQKYYAIPDATAAILFFFHSKKKPRHNLVLGLNVNLSFVKRIKVDYYTAFSELSFINENKHVGMGSYGWNSTAIGITVGYRFFGVR